MNFLPHLCLPLRPHLERFGFQMTCRVLSLSCKAKQINVAHLALALTIHFSDCLVVLELCSSIAQYNPAGLGRLLESPVKCHYILHVLLQMYSNVLPGQRSPRALQRGCHCNPFIVVSKAVINTRLGCRLGKLYVWDPGYQA